MLLNRISTDCDLSEAGVEVALDGCLMDSPRFLVVSTRGLDVGPALARRFGMTLQVDSNLPEDAWYVYNDLFGVFSPGA